MKDYTEEIVGYRERKNAKNSFILRYKVEDINSKKKMTIYFANGKHVSFDYSEILEENILNIMSKEVVDYKELMKDANVEKCRKNESYLLDQVTGLVLIFLGVTLTFAGPGLYWLLALLGFIFLGKGMIGDLINENRFKDFVKNMTFLEHEEELNNLLKSNSLMYENVSQKVLDKCVVKTDKTKGLTINSIEKLKIEDIDNLLSLIEREKMITGIKDENAQIEEKGKIFVKKQN